MSARIIARLEDLHDQIASVTDDVFIDVEGFDHFSHAVDIILSGLADIITDLQTIKEDL